MSGEKPRRDGGIYLSTRCYKGIFLGITTTTVSPAAKIETAFAVFVAAVFAFLA